MAFVRRVLVEPNKDITTLPEQITFSWVCMKLLHTPMTGPEHCPDLHHPSY